MEAEGNEGSAPIAVPLSIPVAKTGVAPALAVDQGKVLFTLPEAQLALRNQEQIVGPNAVTLIQRKLQLPLLRSFHLIDV